MLNEELNFLAAFGFKNVEMLYFFVFYQVNIEETFLKNLLSNSIAQCRPSAISVN